jgi:hypothetical protein
MAHESDRRNHRDVGCVRRFLLPRCAGALSIILPNRLKLRRLNSFLFPSCSQLNAEVNRWAVTFEPGPRIELPGDALTHGRWPARSCQSKSSN